MSAEPGLQPKLAPPGAGLPRVELYIGRMIFLFRRSTGDREKFDAVFRREREAIRALAGRCDAESGARRVLIRRVRGMEDSSRYWSVWMTLDHLRIVNNQIAKVISALGAGVELKGKGSTAAVKPSPEAASAVVAEYEKSCDHFLETAAAIPNLKTPGRYAHPWFGPLDAAGLHALAGGHMGIHRGQIERILAGG